MQARVTLFTLTLLLFGSAAQAGWPEARAAFEGGDYETAARELEAVVAAQPEWAGGHLMLGQAVLKSGDREAALSHLEKAVALAPEDLPSALTLAQTQHSMGRYREVVATLEGRSPDALPGGHRLVFYRLRGDAALRSGGKTLASADLGEAAALSPADAELAYAAAVAAGRAGQTELAAERHGRVIELEPGHPASRRALARHGFEQALATEGSVKPAACEAALATTARWVEVEPGFESWLQHGEAALCAGRPAEAAPSLRLAVQAKPESWKARYALARAVVPAEDWSEAEISLTEAIKAAPPEGRQASVWKLLGYVYEKQDLFDQALGAYRKAGAESDSERVAKNRKIAEDAEEFERLQRKQEALQRDLDALNGLR